MKDNVIHGSCPEPWNESYISTFNPSIPPIGFTIEQIISACDLNNDGPDSCSAKACKIEDTFLLEYFNFAFNGGVMNANYFHNNSVSNMLDFDLISQCPTSEGVKSEKSCCGSYPDRFPFKTYDGARGCCNNSKTYNTDIFSCCADGSVKMSCVN